MKVPIIHNEILHCLLACLATGIIFAEHFQPELKILFASCSIIIVVGIIFTWRKRSAITWRIIFSVIFFVIGVGRFYLADNLPANDISKFANQNVKIFGTIRDEPQHKNFSERFIVEVETVQVGKKKFSASGAMILNSRNQNISAQIGDKISASGNLKFITSYKNPGQIDSVTRMKADGITARMSADKLGVEIENVEGNFFIKFKRFIAAIREHYRESMQKVMSAEDSAAIFAMLFGGYSGINPELVEEFVTTGIVHILSVSGSHMSLLAAATAYFCMMIRLPKTITMIFGISVIVTYMILCGMLAQVIRSAIMGILFLGGFLYEYDSLGKRFLTLVALAMLINNPLLIYDVSFQLSFTSTAGLIYVAPRIKKYLKKLPQIISYPAAITLSAQIASLPIVIWYFNRISLSSIFANIFVMPFLEIVIVGGLVAGFFAFIIPGAGKLLFAGMAIIFSGAAELNKIFANLPFSSIQVPTIDIFAGLIYYVALIFREKKFLLLLIILLAINFFRSSNEFEINFVDVGQGDCAVVFTPNKKCLIFDTGGVREKVFDVGERVLLPYLKHENIFEVEKIFLTHVHEDHSGGASAIIKNLPVHEIITANEPKSEYAAIFGISENNLNNLRAGRQGEKFFIDGVTVEIIFAPKVGTGNEISNVYKISYGEIDFLITGDLVIELEDKILAEKIDVRSEVLKVGHHGSKTSSSEEFLRAVNPKVAVICVGYGNNFGHPRAEVLERLNNIHAKIFRTDIDGLIKFKTDGHNLKVSTYN